MFNDDFEESNSKSNSKSNLIEDIREKQKQLAENFVQNSRKEMMEKFRQNLVKNSHANSSKSKLEMSHLDNYPNKEVLIPKILVWIESEDRPDLLDSFLNELQSNDILTIHHGVIGVRLILSNRGTEYIQQIMDHSSFLKILFFSQCSDHPHLQLESIWCLANLASGTSLQTQSIVQKNIIETFIEISKSKFSQIAEQAIWGLGNIVGDCIEFKNRFVKANGIDTLLQVFETTQSDKIKSYISWVFCNVCRYYQKAEKISPAFKKMIVTLRKLFVYSKDFKTKKELFEGFAHCGNSELIDVWNDEDFFKEFLGFYQENLNDFDNNLSSIKQALTFMGSLSGGADDFTETMIKVGFLPALKNTLFIPNPDIIKFVCWIISNFTLTEPRLIKSVLQEPLLFDTIIKFTTHQNQQSSKEAIYVVCNICICNNLEVIQIVLEKNILEVLKTGLEFREDSETINYILDALRKLFSFMKESTNQETYSKFRTIFLQNGAAKTIEKLQYHKNDSVYFKAHVLLELYFPLVS